MKVLPYFSAKNELYSFFSLNLTHNNSFWLASVQNRNFQLRFPRLRQYPKRYGQGYDDTTRQTKSGSF